MTILHNNVLSRLLTVAMGVSIIIFTALIFASFPARAEISVNSSPAKISNAVQLAQLQICVPPRRRINGVCKLPAIGRQCRPPRRLVNGVCKLQVVQPCLAPRRLINGVCRLPAIRPCRPPRRLVNGVCKLPIVIRPCLPPKRLVNGVCRPPVIQPCRAPRRLINGVCKLPTGIFCLPPKRWIGGICKLPNVVVCQRPRVWSGGRCVLPNPTCQVPFVRSPFSGRCYLPFDIDPIPENECFAPWFYSPEAGGCVKLRPRPRPQENIIWIQSCLNSLGYRAGTEDGLAGRNTRAAWDAFREALGLGGFAGFQDPETLARLYQQCTPRRGGVVPPVSKCPIPAAGGDTCSSGLTYRPSLCATGSLYNLLNEKYGNAVELEQCGRSCVPVPDGMDEAEALRLQSEQGISWCRDCVKVGNEGILCPTPRVPQVQ